MFRVVCSACAAFLPLCSCRSPNRSIQVWQTEFIMMSSQKVATAQKF
jgi:hypothetical protein